MYRAHVRTQVFFQRKSANLPPRGFIALKHKRICVWQICGRLLKMWQIVADLGVQVQFPSGIILLHVSPLKKSRCLLLLLQSET